MKLSLKYSLALIILLLCQYSYGQSNGYQYRRALTEVRDSWHRLELPDELFEKAKKDLSDLRIIGLRHGGDTVIVPYLLRVLDAAQQQEEIAFNIINESRQGRRYYFTLEVPASQEINRINLSFKEKNFDRSLLLEGSQQLGEWFTILEDYRIVSISNASTDYAFTSLHFPTSKYRYYRLSFTAEQKPALKAAKILAEKQPQGKLRSYSLQGRTIREEKKRTVLDLQLPSRLPLSYIGLTVKDTIDYYRPISIQYLRDSTHTAKGWKYHYQNITKGVLSSLEDGAFHFPTTLAGKLRIIIENQDNAALQIGAVTVKGNVHELTARFPEAEAYYLLYGNEAAQRPSYDLEIFADKIPAALGELQIGEEQTIVQESPALASPLFQDQRWLWSIMGIMMLLLGWFSIKMIRKA